MVEASAVGSVAVVTIVLAVAVIVLAVAVITLAVAVVAFVVASMVVSFILGELLSLVGDRAAYFALPCLVVLRGPLLRWRPKSFFSSYFVFSECIAIGDAIGG